MKKFFYIYILFFFIISSTSAYSFVDKRHQWWKLRLENLQEEEKKLSDSGKYDNLVIKILKNDIKRAEKILKIFEDSEKDISSLNQKRYLLNDERINNYVNEITPAFFSLKYFNCLLYGVNKKDFIDKTENFANEKLKEIFSKKYSGVNINFVKKRLSDTIPTNLKKYLSFEIYMGTLVKNFEKEKEQFQVNVLNYIKNSNIPGKITDSELQNKIIEATESLIEGYSVENFNYNIDDVLNSSWVWNESQIQINKNMEDYDYIKNLLKDGAKSTDIEHLQSYLENPFNLEETAFKILFKKYLNKEKFIKNNSSSKELETPGEPDVFTAFQDIDMIRKVYIRKINGTENEKFFNNFKNELSAVIKKYYSTAGTIFYGGYKGLKEKSSDNFTIDKKGEKIIHILPELRKENHGFLESRTIYFRKKNGIEKYIDSSIEFSKWLSDYFKHDPDKIIDAYAFRIKRNKEYLDFILKLKKESSKTFEYGKKEHLYLYMVNQKRITDFFKSLNHTLSLNRDKLISMKKNHFKKLAEIKNDYRLYAKAATVEISTLHRDYFKNINLRKIKQKKINNSIKEKIAQYESELIYENITELKNALEQLNYNEKMFNQYKETYAKIMKSTKDGIFTPQLNDAISKNSLFSKVTKFDEAKFKREYQSKQYIKNSLNRDLAKLTYLSRFYKSKKITLAAMPDKTEMQYIRQKLKDNISATIENWTMHEANYQDIDKKAVLTLRKIKNSILWHNNPKKTNIADKPVKEEKIKGLNLSLIIPEGWNEININNKSIRTFVSDDQKSTIEIICISSKDKFLTEVLENWNKRKSQQIIKTREGSHNNFNYHWSLSKDSKRNIIESYAIKRDDITLVISGKTSKMLYPYFHKKLDSVFKSLDFDFNIVDKKIRTTYIQFDLMDQPNSLEGRTKTRAKL